MNYTDDTLKQTKFLIKIVDPYFLSELSPLVELFPLLRVRVQFCKCISRILLKLGASNFFLADRGLPDEN